jgi:hypothetical protein
MKHNLDIVLGLETHLYKDPKPHTCLKTDFNEKSVTTTHYITSYIHCSSQQLEWGDNSTWNSERLAS